MQHCLPAYFQKCRYYGIHASASFNKIKDKLPEKIKNNQTTIRTLFQIIKAMLGLEEIKCNTCQGTDFEEIIITSDKDWILQWINIPHKSRGSPTQYPHITSNRNGCSKRTGNPMFHNKQTAQNL